MENNEMINNAVNEAATEAVSEAIVSNPSFSEKHPYLNIAAMGALAGAAVGTGFLVVEAVGAGVSKLVDWGEKKIQQRKDKKAAKKASEEIVVESKEEA